MEKYIIQFVKEHDDGVNGQYTEDFLEYDNFKVAVKKLEEKRKTFPGEKLRLIKTFDI